MRERTEAELACDRRRCLNGVCKMTPEERKERRKLYMQRIMDDPFRHKQYVEYFRKRRSRPGMREKTNAQARARYHADIDAAREKERAKYAMIKADPDRLAARNAARKARRRGQDGRPTAKCKHETVLYRLVPFWNRVVAEGREEQYIRRTTDENARLFKMWMTNRPLFDEMMRRIGGNHEVFTDRTKRK